ncbi:hypothetical protein CRM22_001966, partial [Opisthorchis felineus]
MSNTRPCGADFHFASYHRQHPIDVKGAGKTKHTTAYSSQDCIILRKSLQPRNPLNQTSGKFPLSACPQYCIERCITRQHQNGSTSAYAKPQETAADLRNLSHLELARFP